MAAVSVATIVRSSTTTRIKILKLLDAAIGLIILPWIKPAAPTTLPLVTDRIRRILVIRPGGIGDAVLLVPLLRELKRACPQAVIDIVAERRNAAIFTLMPEPIGQVWQLDRDPWRAWRAVVSGSYDLVIDTEQWHHLTALLAHASRAPVRVGFATNLRRQNCYTATVPYSHQDFEGRSFLRIFSMLFGEEARVDWSQVFLAPPAESLAWAAQRVANRRMVAVSLQGGIRERCWEPEKFQALLPRLIERGWDVCFLGGRADVSLANRLHAHLPQPRVLNLTGRTSLIQSAAVLAHCQLFIGTDSGLLHLAYGVGTPAVALFGAGIEAKWAPPPDARRRILNHHLPCSPCTQFGSTPRCPINVQCLREITVEEAWQAALDLSGG